MAKSSGLLRLLLEACLALLIGSSACAGGPGQPPPAPPGHSLTMTVNGAATHPAAGTYEGQIVLRLAD